MEEADNLALAVVPKQRDLLTQAERAEAMESIGADPVTGEVVARGAPGAKLTAAGLRRLREIIIAGEMSGDQGVADLMVTEGWVTSYTSRAVAYWRRHPETQKALAERTTTQLTTGFANRHYRVRQMDKMAKALVRDIFHHDEETGDLVVRPVDNAGMKIAQGQMMGQLNKLIDQIGNVVDVDAKYLQVHVTGEVKHAHAAEMGFSGSAEEVSAKIKAMLADAADEIIEAEYEELPQTVGASLK